ncbi:MAG: biosynthetic-type acetolactate synthase large subunit [Clostridia bacterium]|nr:biosynthetic-type acetolactate synthase large subunit [Clostridia bacterium]
MRINGAEILMNCLIEQGVDTIFGYPGASVLAVYDTLLDFPVRHILTAHEQGACFAAEGYSRASGKVGVVLTTSGPGATNLVTGIADAYMDSIPLVAITGNVSLDNLGHDCFQEIDIFGMTLPIVKYSYIVKSAKELAHTVREAFRIAQSGRKGPVLIDIPTNIFNEISEYELIAPEPILPKLIDTTDLVKIATLINSSERPLIYAGGGVIASGATEQVKALSTKISAHVAVSFMGIGAVPSSFKNYIGVASNRTTAPTTALKECDLLICLGTRFNSRTESNNKLLTKRKLPIVHIDIDNAEIDKNIPTTRAIVGDVILAIEELLPRLNGNANEEWLARDFGEKPIKNRAVDILNSLSKKVDKQTIIVTDVGLHQLWTALTYPVETPRSFLTSGGLGVMGFGLGAAIGAALASGKRVILVTGDGSFNMNLNELATAVKNKLGIMILVMNNSSLGMIRQIQQENFSRRYSQSTLYLKTDYVAFAKSFGADAYSIEQSDDIDKILDMALRHKTPVVIDCKIPINDK